MLFRFSSCLLLAQALLTAATPTWEAYIEYENSISGVFPQHGPKPAPACKPSPRPPFGPLPNGHHPRPPSRTKTCLVKSHNDLKTDDSPYILEAIKECNYGGHVVFSKGTTYIIGTALDLTFLKHIDLDIQGYVQFTNNTDYWQANAFKQIFQNVTTFFQLGGEDVNVYGGGTLDGNGQTWYDLYASNIYILRPVLFGTVGLHGGSISNLNLVYSPQYYNWVANSSDVVFSDIFITGFSKSNNTAKNTDGWDLYRSQSITIQNSTINNGDDCVSFKPNVSSLLVQNLHCNGSHGISVGSLGQYIGETDIVTDVLVKNISMFNASDGARIKVWPGVPSELSGDLQGGGGNGSVSNIVYDGMYIENVDYAIEITQCYGQSNLTLCNQFPSSLSITNVTFRNFQGTTSKKYEPLVGTLYCSNPSVCSGITTENINVTSPEDTNVFNCVNLGDSNLNGLNCTQTTNT